MGYISKDNTAVGLKGCIVYRYTAIAQLREIVMTMERDLGLIALSHNEKDVLYAVQSVLAVSDGVAKSDEIRSHDLVRDMSQPTFHRALKSLLARGLLQHAPDTKAGSYVIKEQSLCLRLIVVLTSKYVL